MVAALVRKSCIEREQRQWSDDAELSSSQPLESPRVLTEEQQAVVTSFQTVACGAGLLLWGITGSGKTEVYLQLAAAELSAGRHVLLLTPEIGLIPQLVDRCRRRFGARVLEYHSGCRDSERLRAWQRCLDPDQPLVVVGTRSAVFMPGSTRTCGSG